MDSSNSRRSDAAATRKRRSSILKCQRAPRAPLSELEFHVATPQEQAKSRRVSFSRRTGVAEFEINEATTAWKNVYEEHNKSLETSANESGVRGAGGGGGGGGGGGARRRVQHLGARAAQFEDEEADELDVEAPPAPAPAPHDLSACTDHRTVQLFRLDAAPAMRDLTDRLDVDFSAVAPLADAPDDLDVLRQDLERDSRGGDMSEISIDVDFNATHVSLKAEESGTDMSITDTVRSPRVAATAAEDSKSRDDWSADKENIAVNPYVAPPSADFASDADCDDILVFDGKKCKFQSNLEFTDVADEAAGDVPAPHRVVLPALPTPTENTLGECDVSVTRALPGSDVKPEESPLEHKTLFFDDVADLTVTQPVPAQMLQEHERERRRTIVYDGDDGHVSMTEAVPAQVLPPEESERRKTILYGIDDGHVSTTETVLAQISQQKESELRKTIVYEDDDCNLSVTVALPAQILPQNESDRLKTIVYEKDDGHISMTEAVPAQILQEKECERRKTLVYGKDDGNLSVTEAVPAQILQQKEPERRRTIVYGNDDGHISMTEAVPAQILSQNKSERRTTMMYDNDDGHISMTEAVPAKILQQEEYERGKTILYGNDEGNLSVTQAVPAQFLPEKEPDRRKTIVYGNDDGHISMTEVVPARILQQKESERRSMMYEKDDGHVSMTETVPAQIFPEEPKRKAIMHDADDRHVMTVMTVTTVTEAGPTQTLHQKEATVVCYNDCADISFTQAVPGNIINASEVTSKDEPIMRAPGKLVAAEISESVIEKQQTVIFYNTRDLSMTREVIQEESPNEQAVGARNDDSRLSVTVGSHITLDEGLNVTRPEHTDRRGTTVHGNDGDVSRTKEEPANILVDDEAKLAEYTTTNRRKTMDNSVDVFMTEPISAHITDGKDEKAESTQPVDGRTMVCDDDQGDISMTRVIQTDVMDKGNVTKADTIKPNDSQDDASTTGVIHNSVTTSQVQSNECDKEYVMMRQQKEPSQIIVYEDGELEVSRSVAPHPAPAIEPEESQASGAGGEPPGQRASPAASPAASRKSSHSLYEDVKGPPTAGQFGALSLRSALESASMLNALAQSPQRRSLMPPPLAADRTSVLDLLLDMSSDEAPIPERSPQPADSEATITNSLASNESYILIRDDEPAQPAEPAEPAQPAALEASQPLPLEYKKDKHGIVCKLKRRLSDLKDLIRYKEKISPKKDAKATDSVDDLESQVTLTPPVTGTACPDGGAASPAGAGAGAGADADADADADDTRALLEALSHLTDSRRSGSFAGRSPRAPRATSLALEQKPAEPRPNRKSMVRSREDLLKDISMAQALMQAESEQAEEETETDAEMKPVVRTLRFDDEEPSAVVLRKPVGSPDASPRSERAAVIPAYPSGVSDHLKELVEELMKPMADVAPVYLSRKPEPGRGAGRGAGAGHSASAQADLLESSQIDLLSSRPVVLRPRSPVSCAAHGSASLAPENFGRHLSDESLMPDSDAPLAPHERVIIPRSPTKPAAPATGAVIVFDHLNPLNNVVLPPASQAAAHKYDPRGSAESLSPSLGSAGTQTEARRNNECGVMVLVSPARRDRAVVAAESRAPLPRALRLRDTEVNTAIVMKPNRDLLAASSSLTLVDDALARGSPARSRSPMRVIFKLEEPHSSVMLDSQLTSAAEVSDGGKALKRGRSPKKCTFADDATPKPAIKVQKITHSARVLRRLKSLPPTTTARPAEEGARRRGGSAVTVQHLLPEFRAFPSAPSSLLASDSSCAGSLRSGSASASRTDWQPELLYELSSKDLVSECDPSVNVVAKIDVLPFMGTSECEWESRAADTWSFLLLRARLRLVVRLQHRANNAARALVRADTPVTLVAVQHAHPEAECRDAVAALCLRLLAAALRAGAAGVAAAGAVPALLRRGAALARVALRWARVMRAAHVRLAFTLTPDGLLSLKVANIPMRSVWEVTLRVELAEGGEGGGGGWAWPRAADVRVARVVADWEPGADELRRLLAPLPRDWGHVPRTVWKIFKYLKYKKPEDEFLCA